jgi:hypothetical protein
MIMPGSPHDGTNAPSVILDVDGRSYAFGLRWTSAIARASLVSEAQTAAAAEGATHVALHSGFNQFGIAFIHTAATGWRGVAFRPFVGAAAIAEAVGSATLAAFPLQDERWLVLAIDRKGILPDGDLVVADAAAARARVEFLLKQSPTSWRRKFLPADWKIADSRTISPQDLLGKSRAPRLVSLWLLTHRRRAAIAFGVLAAALALALIQTVRLLDAPAPVAQAPFEAPKPVAAVWTPAELAIDRCLSAFRDSEHFQAVPGWAVARYDCQGGEGVTISFVRTGDGEISVLSGLVPAAQLSDDGRSAALFLPLPVLPRISATAEFASRQRYQLIGLDLAQRLNGTLAIQAMRKPLPGETAASSPNQAWKAFTWTYQTQAPAIVWASAIARFGSIAIDTLSYSPTDKLWQLTGSLYANN